MRQLLAPGILILTCVLCLGTGTAIADVSVDLDIKNKSCDSSGNDVHARAGDQVCAKLKVKNESRDDVTMQIRIVGGIPSCMVDTTVTIDFDGKENKKHELCGIVPEGLDGEMLIIVVSARSSDGCSADACAKLTFGARSDGDDDDDDDDGDDNGGNGDGDNGDGDGDHGGAAEDSHGPRRGGLYGQIFVRMLSRSLVSGFVRDTSAATADASFSEFKQLYR